MNLSRISLSSHITSSFDHPLLPHAKNFNSSFFSYYIITELPTDRPTPRGHMAEFAGIPIIIIGWGKKITRRIHKHPNKSKK